MSFQKEYRMVYTIKKYFSELFRPSQNTASSARKNTKQSRNNQSISCKGQDTSPKKAPAEAPAQHPTQHLNQHSNQHRASAKKTPQEDIADYHHTVPAHQEKNNQNHDQQKQKQSESKPQPEIDEIDTNDGLITGGIYALQEQEDGPDTVYWLAKVIYVEKQVVHVLCYAERADHLAPDLLKQELTIGLNSEDSSFGLAHLPLAKDDFAANAVLLGQRSLKDNDLAGYQIYVDSVFDCLDEQAPDWLKKAASFAAWRYDRNAMAALADRYLIGVDLLRDSKKALYWINRLVHAGKGQVQPFKTIRKEQDILTGGIYAFQLEEAMYQTCKIVLKDKHSVQCLNFPSLLGQLPEGTHPVQIVEQVATRRAGTPPMLSHVSRGVAEFLAQAPVFLGLLPVTLNELHCYRAHLPHMFDGAVFRESAWNSLLRRAQQGEAQAQLETACHYLDGDPAWEVQRNISEAIRWFTEAANQGHSLAAYNLALLFLQGAEEIQPDPQLGLEWMTYSAQLNYGLAQLCIADCYQHGKGCPASPALAHAWYSLAITADNNLSEEARKKARQRKYYIEGTCSDKQLAAAKQYFLQLQGAGSDVMSSQGNMYGDMYA
ncbi:tetratricopeptide repeat protein [Candidatus Electrothrix sp.]|uniref:tetratricopeptide repeat protein n=1 Tax=Candidatus Electrothrix sp. TaxID=2170559 RepID=UPI004055DC7F